MPSLRSCSSSSQFRDCVYCERKGDPLEKWLVQDASTKLQQCILPDSRFLSEISSHSSSSVSAHLYSVRVCRTVTVSCCCVSKLSLSVGPQSALKSIATTMTTKAKPIATSATKREQSLSSNRSVRSSSRLAGKKRALEPESYVHRPKPGASAFHSDCGILPSE